MQIINNPVAFCDSIYYTAEEAAVAGVECTCPACGKPVYVRAINSERKRPHFAHYRGTACRHFEAAVDGGRHNTLHRRFIQLNEEGLKNLALEMDGVYKGYQLFKKEGDIKQMVKAISQLSFENINPVKAFIKHCTCFKEEAGRLYHAIDVAISRAISKALGDIRIQVQVINKRIWLMNKNRVISKIKMTTIFDDIVFQAIESVLSTRKKIV